MTEIILGPPGTGKTTTLLNILDDELTSGTLPARIGYVSFTRRAAEEAVTRACSRFALERAQFPNFRTLHSLCYRQLGTRNSDLLVGKSFFEFARWAGIRVTGRAFSEDGLLGGFEQGDRILFMENLARIREIPLREQYEMDDDHLPWSEVDRVARSLAKYKETHGLMDYTDLLSEFVRSRIRVELDVLLVDEAQDLSRLQWHVVERLAIGARRVVIAGDDDQAIYRWAGADVEHLIGMEGDARVLGQSWRCPPVIQRLSSDIIGTVVHRREKKWKARKGERGVMDRVEMFDDADCEDKWIDGDDVQPILILARNSYVLNEQVEPGLRAQGIVFERNGKNSVDLGALRAAQSWEALRKGDGVTLDEVRKMYEYLSANRSVKRGYKTLKTFGDEEQDVFMNDLVQYGGLRQNPDLPWHEALDRLPPEEMSYMLAARRRGEKLTSRPRVRLSTIHGAKGGEARHVVLMTEMARRTFREMEQNPDDEARVFYVGVTRAKSRLTVVHSQTAQSCPWL